jgi:hypothetical protein
MHPLGPGNPLLAENPWAAGKYTETTHSIGRKPGIMIPPAKEGK